MQEKSFDSVSALTAEFFGANVKGDAAALGTLVPPRGFSPPPRPSCPVLAGGGRVHRVMLNDATLPKPGWNSKPKARQRKVRDDRNHRGASLGMSQCPAANHLRHAQEDFAQRRRDAKYGFPRFIPLFLLRLGGFARDPLLPMDHQQAEEWLGK